MFGLDGDQTARLVYLTVLLVIVLGSVQLGRTRAAGKLRYLGVWVLIAAVLIVIYIYSAPELDFAAPALRDSTPGRAE